MGIQKMTWKPIDTAPNDRPFLAAEYLPTNWAYRVVHINPRRFKNNERLRELNMRGCRAWMECPDEPDGDINERKNMDIQIESYADGWMIKIGDKHFNWDHNDPDLGTIGIKAALEELGHTVEIEECY